MSNAKRLATNTIYMYIRMFILLLISLYSSRVLLQQLGVEDFGVYNLVGSIIAMLSSLRGLFSASTQRFLNYEMGRGNTDKLQVIFNMSLVINLIISILFFASVEILGCWFLNYKINIDPSRLFAAKIVFQLSVISSIVTIMITSFDAVIIANERMKFYAYMSIIEGVLKLAIIFMLALWPNDKLVFYAILHFVVTIIVGVINVIYCRRNFKESHFKKCWNKPMFNDMASFAGWNFFGNLGFSLSNEGVNMILNVFGGPVVNAARGIAYQVRAAIYMFLGNVNKAIDPYSTKLFAREENSKFFELMFFTTKILFAVYLCISIPLFIYTEPVLSMWLGEVPPYAVIFVKLILILGLLKSFFSPIDVLYMSANRLKHYQLVNICVSSITVLFSWISLSLGFDYYAVFVVAIITSIFSLLIFILLAGKECNLNIKSYFNNVLVKAAITLIIVAFVSEILKYIFESNMAFIIIVKILVTILVTAIVSYLFSFTQQEKEIMLSLVKNINHKQNDSNS